MSFTEIKKTAARVFKKILFFTVTTAAALLLCSCQNDLIYLYDDTDNQSDVGEENVPFMYEDNGDRADNVKWISNSVVETNIAVYNNELYFTGNVGSVEKNKFTLFRYNPETGNVTSVCPDPACGHNTYDCPFYGISSSYAFYIENDIVYYKQNYVYTEEHSGNPMSDPYTDINGFSMYDMKTGKYKWLRDAVSAGTICNMVVYDGVCFYNDVVEDEDEGEWLYKFCSQGTKTEENNRYSRASFSRRFGWTLRGIFGKGRP